MSRHRTSLRRRLIGVILLGILAALSVTYAALLAYEFHSFRQTTARNLSALAGIIAANSSAALDFDDAKLAHENLAALRSEREIAAAALYDASGKLYTTYISDAAHVRLPDRPGSDGIEFKDGRLVLFYPVAQDRKRDGTLYLESSLAEMHSRFRVYGVVLLMVLAGALIVAFFFSDLFQRRISAPIFELAEMARTISEKKNYSIRSKTAGDDEIGDLTRAFNTMLEQIEASHSEAERARDEAVAASKAKDNFIAALSHELRTPLNPVLLIASDGAWRTDLPAEVRQDFETIRRNVELEARLIDDLLDLSRIVRGKLALQHRNVDLIRVIEDAIGTIQADAEAKLIEISLYGGAARPVVWGDPVRLQQVFWNVLKNAVKFTPPRGRVAIFVREDPAAGRVKIAIEDSGIGLTPEEMKRLFQVFSQGEHADNSPHRFGGLGLGLAISKTLVELHQGTIRAESPGRALGATFLIELPLAPGPEKGSAA